jgi:hypothetical protein
VILDHAPAHFDSDRTNAVFDAQHKDMETPEDPGSYLPSA